MSHLVVAKDSELRELARRLRDTPVIAYDTEFISEGRYAPQLCLIQFAAGGLSGLIDPLSVETLDPFWELLCDDRRDVLVHAGRSEMEFCHRAVGRMPRRVFDVQLAAGFIGIDYPTGFGTLLSRLLGIDLRKEETRTVWNRRPLSPRQIDYALDDVLHLEQLAAVLREKLRQGNRLGWYEEEIAEQMKRFRKDFETPRWRNLPKSSSLKPQELAVMREVWFWRDEIARKWNVPSGRVLRDDLVVELARRKTDDPKRIAAVRGFQRNDLAKILPGIAAAVKRALEQAPEEWPSPPSRVAFPQYGVMTPFLHAALGAVCKRKTISQRLVAGPEDIREWIAAELGTLPPEIKPKLAVGWRAGLVGPFLDDLLRGRIALRLNAADPNAPLVFSETQ